MIKQQVSNMKRNTVENAEDRKIYMTIGANTRVYLMLRKKTQSQLARALGITPSTITQKMQGSVAWFASDVYRISEFLNVPIDKLYSTHAVNEFARAYEPIA